MNLVKINFFDLHKKIKSKYFKKNQTLIDLLIDIYQNKYIEFSDLDFSQISICTINVISFFKINPDALINDIAIDNEITIRFLYLSYNVNQFSIIPWYINAYKNKCLHLINTDSPILYHPIGLPQTYGSPKNIKLFNHPSSLVAIEYNNVTKIFNTYYLYQWFKTSNSMKIPLFEIELNDKLFKTFYYVINLLEFKPAFEFKINKILIDKDIKNITMNL